VSLSISGMKTNSNWRRCGLGSLSECEECAKTSRDSERSRKIYDHMFALRFEKQPPDGLLQPQGTRK
jgi:hypothetical protein